MAVEHIQLEFLIHNITGHRPLPGAGKLVLFLKLHLALLHLSNRINDNPGCFPIKKVVQKDHYSAIIGVDTQFDRLR